MNCVIQEILFGLFSLLATKGDLPLQNSLDISSALWLKTHGLVARRLTIMDALAPTAVPHGTKYIPVLDKHVVSKVIIAFPSVYCRRLMSKCVMHI
uniref:Secreted protein n=1 Tax=Amazona collaria TaxID=241587 RepID=A0A8B9F9F5_9PSIT